MIALWSTGPETLMLLVCLKHCEMLTRIVIVFHCQWDVVWRNLPRVRLIAHAAPLRTLVIHFANSFYCPYCI